MRAFIIFIFALIAIEAKANNEIFTHFESFSYSEPVSIKTVLNKLQGDFSSGQEAFTHNEIELGIRRGNWSFSWLARYDYYLSFHSDTAELFYLDENKLPVQLNRRYQLDIKGNRLNAQGLRLAYAFEPTNTLQTEIAVTYLRASQLLDGEMSGAITTDNSGNYSGQARVDYVYDQDLLLERPVDSAVGDGISIDLRLRWQINQRLAAGITSKDLFNVIHWKNAPYSAVQVTSSVVTFDANGFIDTQPVLSGVEGFRNHSQHLPVRTTSWATWQWNQHIDAGAELFSVADLHFPRIRMQHNLADDQYLNAFWDFKAKALGLSYHHHGFQLSFISDETNLSDAHTLGFSLSWIAPFNL